MNTYASFSDAQYFEIFRSCTEIISFPYTDPKHLSNFLYGISPLNLCLRAIIPHKNSPCTLATFHAIIWMWLFVVANAQLTNKMCGEPK